MYTDLGSWPQTDPEVRLSGPGLTVDHFNHVARVSWNVRHNGSDAFHTSSFVIRKMSKTRAFYGGWGGGGARTGSINPLAAVSR